jgi:acrylyl-CoA reductase (NADPH)
VPIPDGIDEWEAMALGTAGLTAALAIHKLELNGLRPEGGPVAVTGATGGVGSLATDMLAGLGYEVTSITGK